MSKEINNREYRKGVIKEMIAQLHAGKSVDEVKQKFEETFDGVSATEISEVEQALIAEGLPVSEVQRLCDVHAAVFKGSIEQIHQSDNMAEIPGHPAHTLKVENRALQRLMEGPIRTHLKALETDTDALLALRQDLERLWQIDLHYVKKENLLFPYMEKYGITAPPKVMWGVDDEIRALLKQAREIASADAPDAAALRQAVATVIEKAVEMIFKEENILMPMLLETLTPQEWKHIAEQEAEMGYSLISAPPVWNPPVEKVTPAPTPAPAASPGVLTLPTGVLRLEELVGIFNTLPVDITFVDKDETVKYFSEGGSRVFPRTKAVIGRKVTNCHPPASVHIVEKIVDDLRTGRKDHEDFWIKMGDKYILIRYFAVRDENGEFLGTLEVTQDIAPIQRITDEKRLVSD